MPSSVDGSCVIDCGSSELLSVGANIDGVAGITGLLSLLLDGLVAGNIRDGSRVESNPYSLDGIRVVDDGDIGVLGDT